MQNGISPDVDASRHHDKPDKYYSSGESAVTHLKTLSVITVTKNNLEGLRRTITSINRDTPIEVEHIVVDGASGDGTREFLEALRESEFSWISEPDSGIYDAMNKGVRKATGEFILFLNAGDRFVEGALAELWRSEIQWHAYDVVYGDVIDRSTGVLLKAREPAYLSRGMPFCHQAALVRATWSRRLPFDTRFRVVADFDFFLRAHSYGAKFLQTKACIAEFEGGGLSSSPSWATHCECATALWRHSPNGQRVRDVIKYWGNQARFRTYWWAIRWLGEARVEGARTALRKKRANASPRH